MTESKIDVLSSRQALSIITCVTHAPALDGLIFSSFYTVIK